MQAIMSELHGPEMIFECGLCIKRSLQAVKYEPFPTTNSKKKMHETNYERKQTIASALNSRCSMYIKESLVHGLMVWIAERDR